MVVSIRDGGTQAVEIWYFKTWGEWQVVSHGGTGYVDHIADATTDIIDLVVTFDGTTLRTYADGIPGGTDASITTAGILGDSGAIGARGNAPTVENFDGLIKEVRFYDYALTPESAVALHDRHTAPAEVVAGIAGNALALNGIDQYVPLPAGVLGPDDTTSFSISAWVKIDSLAPAEANVRVVSFWEGSGTGEISLRFADSTDQWAFFIVDSAGNANAVTTGASSATTDWQHLVVTYDGSTKAMAIYLDAGTPGTGTYTRNAMAPTVAYIGGRAASVNFDGIIDEIRIFSRALTAAEVASLYRFPGGMEQGVIDASFISADTIVGAQIVAGSIGTDHLVALAITADKIDALAVTAAKIAGDTITADKIDSGTLQAQFAKIAYILTVGFSGTGTEDAPDAGDTRHLITGSEDSFQEANSEGNWENRGSISRRPGSNVFDMFLSGFFKAGEGVLSLPGHFWRTVGTPWTGGRATRGLAWGNNTLVAGNSFGEIETSTDGGDTWTARTTPFTKLLNANVHIGFGHDVFVAVTDDGQIARSTNNGASWGSLISNSHGGDEIWDLATDGAGNWVIVGENGKISISSNDGASWSSLISNPFGGAGTILAIAYGDGIFLAGGTSKELAWSDDAGATWSALVSNGFGGGTAIAAIKFGDHIFVIANNIDNESSRSVDLGLTWSTPIATGASQAIQGLTFFDGVWLAGGWTTILKSTDGAQSWSFVSTLGGSAKQLGSSGIILAMAYDEQFNQWVASGTINTPGTTGDFFISGYTEAGAGIIEQGSNANGEYMIFSNGLQICWGASANASHNYSAVGNGFATAAFTHTFAKAFAATPKVFTSAFSDSFWSSGFAISTTQYRVKHNYWVTLSGRTDSTEYLAIGQRA